MTGEQNNTEEIWRDVPGFEGIYQASNQGRIKSLDRFEKFQEFKRGRKGRILKQRLDRYGYPCVALMKNSFHKHFTVHRIIALVWIGEPTGPQINHKDGIKINNLPENLEYCSSQENVIHSHKTGLSKKRLGKANSLSMPVLAIKDTAIIEFDCLRECAEYIGVTVQAVWNAMNGKARTTKGFSIYEA